MTTDYNILYAIIYIVIYHNIAFTRNARDFVTSSRTFSGAQCAHARRVPPMRHYGHAQLADPACFWYLPDLLYRRGSKQPS